MWCFTRAILTAALKFYEEAGYSSGHLQQRSRSAGLADLLAEKLHFLDIAGLAQHSILQNLETQLGKGDGGFVQFWLQLHFAIKVGFHIANVEVAHDGGGSPQQLTITG